VSSIGALEAGMKRLPEVEAAKQLMNEATKWSVMTWLREKKRVRRTADQANAALDRLSDQLRQRWPQDLRIAYHALSARTNGESGEEEALKNTEEIAKKLKAADDEAYRARLAAEQTFDDAEKRLSTSLAREGCVKAIRAWELHEKAISQAEKCIP
jgi:hypothetical protein